MGLIDWLIVLLLNGAVIACGLYLARSEQSSSDFFLGSRALPWWAVGMSMFATNVDNADLVAVTSNTYSQGLHIITVYAVGSAVGGILAAFLVVPAIYRLGFYTNAEYLEARFGPTARILSALIQLQYRSSMLGLMIYSVFLLLTQLVSMPEPAAWGLIVASVVLAGCYTAWGGLKSVVWTDALQGVIMMLGGAVIFGAVWQAVGGWSGMTSALDAAGEVDGLRLGDLPHIGRYRGESGQIHPFWIAVGWTIIGSGYWTVNHTQTMRLMGSRSVWDMKMAALFGVAASLPIMIACSALGVFARALPEFQHVSDPNTIYPLLANHFLGPGLKGLVVAGVVAAAVSTFDSMGSALSAIFTRDIYARFIYPDGEDEHYVKVGRFATVAVLALGFLYLPLIMLQKNMLDAFTTLIPVFVTPLFSMYLLGVLTRCHRRSGVIGLLVGSAYGVLALVDREVLRQSVLPAWLSSQWAALSWSLTITTGTMALVTLVLGREPAGALGEFHEKGWLDRSRESLPPLREHPFQTAPPAWLNPVGLAVLVLLACAWLEFYLL